MICPICADVTAEDVTVATFDGITIQCPSCGLYDVSGTVWGSGLLQKLEPDARARALMSAKRSTSLLRRPMVQSTDI